MSLRQTLLPALLRTALLGLALAATAGPTRAACDVQWQLTPQASAGPAGARSLLLSLSFQPGNRSRSLLRLPGQWQGVEPLPDQPALQAVADDPTLRSVEHPAGQPLTLRWRISPRPGDPTLRLEPAWLAATGQSVLPMPEESVSASTGLCVTLDGLPAGSRFVGSHGSGQGERFTWQFSGGAAQAQLALFAGGALGVLGRQAEGQALQLAVPEGAGMALGPEALADAVAAAAGAQRRFWRDADALALTVLALPGPVRSTPEGTALGAALLLQVPVDVAQPGARLEAAITEALLRQRLPDRLGPRVVVGRRDEALRAWLAEGLVAFYTHRLLLLGGAWTPEDYATELNRRIVRYLDSPTLNADNLKVATGWVADPALAELPAARGELLALHWHNSLRAAGQPGLDAVLRKLMLPAAQARREGPLSAPLASHRLIAALRQTLDDAPLREVGEHIDRGVPFSFQAGTLGPCFRMSLAPRPDFRLGFDRASLAAGVARGVEPGGPAEAAGLKDGMAIRGYRMVPGDAEQAVWLQLQDADGSLRTISYLPAGSRSRDLPRYSPVPQALQQPACQAWLQGEGGTAVALGRALTGPVAGGRGAKAKAGKHGAVAAAKGKGKAGAKVGGKASSKGSKAATKGAAAKAGGTAKGGAKAGKTSAKARH